MLKRADAGPIISTGHEMEDKCSLQAWMSHDSRVLTFFSHTDPVYGKTPLWHVHTSDDGSASEEGRTLRSASFEQPFARHCFSWCCLRYDACNLLLATQSCCSKVSNFFSSSSFKCYWNDGDELQHLVFTRILGIQELGSRSIFGLPGEE